MERLRRVTVQRRESHPKQAAWQEGMDRLNWVEGLGQRAVLGSVAGVNPLQAMWQGDRGIQFTHAAESKLLGGYDVSKLPEGVQFALDFVTQTIADPITYVPGLDVLVLASKATRFAKAIKLIAEYGQKVPEIKKLVDRAAPVLHAMTSSLPGQVAGKVLRVAGATVDTVSGARAARWVGNQVVGRPARYLHGHVRPYVDAHYALHKEAGQHAERAVSRDVIMAHARHDARMVRFDALMQKWGKFMDHTGNVPQPVREELDRLSYLLGTKEVRNQAIKHGFRPTAEERAAPIVNRITEYRPHYEPKQRLRPEPGAPPVLEVRHGGVATGEAAFNRPQTVGDTPLGPLSQRVRERMEQESRDLHNHSGAMRAQQNYGLLGRRVNTFRTVNGKRVLDTERGPRFSGASTLGGRTTDAVARAKEAEAAGDLKRAQRYRSLVSKQNLLQGGATPNRVEQNVGEINLTKEEAERRAARAIIEKGLGGKERAMRKGKLTAKESLGSMKQDLRTKRMATTRAQLLARKAQQAAEKTQALTKAQADSLSRLLTERNADFRGTLRTVRDKTRSAVLGKPQVLGDNGPIHDLPNLAPVTKRQKLTPAQQRIVSPSEQAHNKYSWTETQGQGAHVAPMRRMLGKPSAKIAERMNALAKHHHAMMMTAAKKLLAADEANRFRQAVTEHRDAALASENTVAMPKALQERIYNADPVVRVNPLAKLAQAGRDMMFITSVPHKLNIGGEAMETERGNAIPLSATAGGVGKIVKGTRLGKKLKIAAEGSSELEKARQSYLKGSSTPRLSPERQKAFNEIQQRKKALEGERGWIDKKAVPGTKAASDAIEEGLVNVGAPVKYSRVPSGAEEQRPAYVTSPIGKAAPWLAKGLEARSNRSSASLHRFETGIRSAELEKLKKRGIVDPVEQGGELRDQYGNYHERSKLVRHLQDLVGAQFPNFRASVVPRAGSKALTQRPRAVHEMLNLIRDFNYDVAEPSLGGDIRVGGNPLVGMSEIAGRAWHYGLSQATIGPLGIAGKVVDQGDLGALRSGVNEALDYTVPAAPQIKSLLNSKGAPINRALRLLLSGGGWDLEPVKQRAPYYPPGYVPR